MAKRFVFTKMVQVGDEIAPKVAAYTENYRAWSSSSGDLCVCQAAFPSLEQVQADAGAFVFDDLPLGVQWSTVPQVRRNEIAAAIRAIGFTFDAHATWSIKQVIEHVIHQVAPGVNIERGDVQDPWG